MIPSAFHMRMTLAGKKARKGARQDGEAVEDSGKIQEIPWVFIRVPCFSMSFLGKVVVTGCYW